MLIRKNVTLCEFCNTIFPDPQPDSTCDCTQAKAEAVFTNRLSDLRTQYAEAKEALEAQYDEWKETH